MEKLWSHFSVKKILYNTALDIARLHFHMPHFELTVTILLHCMRKLHNAYNANKSTISLKRWSRVSNKKSQFLAIIL